MDRFDAHRPQRFGLRTHERQAGFILLPEDVAARPSQAFTHPSPGRPAAHRGYGPGGSERDAAIVAAWTAGRTMPQIGAEFGISRQRVGQILRDRGAPRAAARAPTARPAKGDDGALVQEIRDEVDRHPGISFAALADQLSVSTRQVRRLLPDDLRSRVIGSPEVTHPRRWTDEKVKAALQQAATFAFPLTARAYRDLLDSGQIAGPSPGLIGRRYGGWAKACDLAGVECGTTTYLVQSEWTDTDLRGFVREYLDSPGSDGTISGYRAWRKTKQPDAPGVGTVRNRFGSWVACKRTALQDTGGSGGAGGVDD